MHWGDRITVGEDRLNEVAEVALLTRSIVIQGAEEADPQLGKKSAYSRNSVEFVF